MISVDTNILVYATNPEAAKHAEALAFMQSLAQEEIALCELVLIELYMALRNPAIFPMPYTAKEAAEHCEYLRSNRRWTYIDYEPQVAPKLWKWAANTRSGFRHVIDARIAFTLLHHGVSDFATINTKNFKNFGFRRVWNPLRG